MWLPLILNNYGNNKTICIKVYDCNKKQTKGEFPKISLAHFISLPMYNSMYIVIFIYLKVYILLCGCLITSICYIGHYVIQYADSNFIPF